MASGSKKNSPDILKVRKYQRPKLEFRKPPETAKIMYNNPITAKSAGQIYNTMSSPKFYEKKD